MRYVNPLAPEYSVRLAYCTNVHPASELPGLLGWLNKVALPLARRMGVERDFGVGLYLPMQLARELARDRSAVESFARELQAMGLDAFTFNAFPAAAFGEVGNKSAVFEPAWDTPARAEFTLDVARIALGLAESSTRTRPGDHISISTHTGAHASALQSPARREACRQGIARALVELSNLGHISARRIVLALEPEPRSLCNDFAALGPWHAELSQAVRERLGNEPGGRALAALGTCLDTCHAAVEFEASRDVLEHATAAGASLGKLQFTSALRLENPARNCAAREQLFALDEPRFLHQVTARTPLGLVRAADLGEARGHFERADPAWMSAEEMRCHFHVPVDLESMGTLGLATTRAHADACLAGVLAAPKRWGTRELHLEIETYTWDILPAQARGAGDLVEGLAREYAHAAQVLESAGYRPDAGA